MPYSQRSSNIRKIRSKYREGKVVVFTLPEATAEVSPPSTLSISGTSSLVLDANVPDAGIIASSTLLISPTDNTGREAKISISANPAFLEVFVEPENDADRFVIIKKVNVVMPAFTLDANGKPI